VLVHITHFGNLWFWFQLEKNWTEITNQNPVPGSIYVWNQDWESELDKN
jgi:hypothetical protein